MADIFAALPPQAVIEAVNRRGRPEDWRSLLEKLTRRANQRGHQAKRLTDLRIHDVPPGEASVPEQRVREGRIPDQELAVHT
ncbi:hypothetical protein ACFXKF_17055 [Streptomyces scopuliridis]|uniref:hypothetical protein n=1 Tax=Streptomyces scopuliridis TaxID=452529 RepID=UPI0036C3034A